MEQSVNSRDLINSWGRSDFLESTAPYEYLYSFINDKFALTQTKERLRARAREIGVTSFVKMWNEYLRAVQPAAMQPERNMTQFTGQPVELDCGNYSCTDDGVSLIDRNGFTVQVCSHPLTLEKRFVNVETGEVRFSLAFCRGSIWRSLVVEREILMSRQKIVSLARYGLGVTSENSNLIVPYLSDLEALNFERIPQQNSTGRLGWIPKIGFSPYSDNLVFDGNANFRNAFECVRQEGDFKVWLNCAKKAWNYKKTNALLLAASFSSVMVNICHSLPFIVHIWGGTGAGKSVLLMLCASVWAYPGMGDYVVSFNSTKVAREMLAGFCNSLPLIMDEFQVESADSRASFDRDVYMLTEGVGRGRGAKSGGIQANQTWKNCIITNGETPISNGRSAGGAVNRIIEIPCGDEALFTDFKETVAIISANFGHAGRRLVEVLTEEDSEDMVRALHEDYSRQLRLRGITSKQADAAGIILTAGQIVADTLFAPGDVEPITVDDIFPYLTGADEIDQNERCYDWLNDWIAANPARFRPSEFSNGEVWGMTDEVGYTYINRSILEKVLTENGFNLDSFAAWAIRHGLIKTQTSRPKYPYITKTLPGTRQTMRCLALEGVANKELREKCDKSGKSLYKAVLGIYDMNADNHISEI